MFLVFEGIDGSGKSTQAKLLAEYLRQKRGMEVTLVREPGGTELGERLRQILLEPGSEALSPETELFLFMAARSHLVRTRIRPALDKGQVVVSDRFLWSSVAYQGIGGGIDPGEILRMGRLATRGLEVTKIVLVDVKPEIGLERATSRNRMEGRGLQFQRRVREGFLSLAEEDSSRVAIVDGQGTPEEVHARVLQTLAEEGVVP